MSKQIGPRRAFSGSEDARPVPAARAVAVAKVRGPKRAFQPAQPADTSSVPMDARRASVKRTGPTQSFTKEL